MSNVNRVEKLIINLDTAMPLSCAYRDCWKRARTSHQVRIHEHLRTVKCSELAIYGGRHTIYAFCSEGCKDLWLAETGEMAKDTAARNRGQIAGRHTPGMRKPRPAPVRQPWVGPPWMG